MIRVPMICRNQAGCGDFVCTTRPLPESPLGVTFRLLLARSSCAMCPSPSGPASLPRGCDEGRGTTCPGGIPARKEPNLEHGGCGLVCGGGDSVHRWRGDRYGPTVGPVQTRPLVSSGLADRPDDGQACGVCLPLFDDPQVESTRVAGPAVFWRFVGVVEADNVPRISELALGCVRLLKHNGPRLGRLAGRRCTQAKT